MADESQHQPEQPVARARPSARRRRRVGRARRRRVGERPAARGCERGSSACPASRQVRRCSSCRSCCSRSWSRSDYQMQVGIDTLIFMLLALGLNVAVGWAGPARPRLRRLLRLRRVRASPCSPPTTSTALAGRSGLLPIVVVATALLGFLVGLPSRRLTGDYLAIVTLFFLQIFLTLLLNADRLNFPFHEGAIEPHPRPERDLRPRPAHALRLEARDRSTSYFYFVLGAFVARVRRRSPS